MRSQIPLQDRLEASIERESNSDCWLWTKHITSNGYAQMRIGCKADNDRKNVYAHRVSYEIYKGKIPNGLTIDHLCRVRSCVNPDHLEAVTLRENLARGETLAARNLAKTHCPRGHRYDDENTHTDKNGRRHCLACNRMRQKIYYWERKELQ